MAMASERAGAVRAERRRTQLGVVRSNPVTLAQLSAPTEILATGVTIGDPVSSSDPMNANATTANSTIANSRPIRWDDPLWFNLIGVQLSLYGATHPNNKVGVTANYATHNVQRLGLDVEFEFYGQSFEFAFKYISSNSEFRISVDDHPVTADPVNIASSVGSLYLVSVTFATRAQRRIRIQGENFPFAGIRVDPTADVDRSPLDPGPLLGVLSDSFGEGTGARWRRSSWVDVFARCVGIKRILNSSSGGTGFLNDDVPGGKVTYRARLQSDLIVRSPDLYLIAGGYNDSPYTDNAIQTEVGLLIDAIEAGAPGKPIVVVGCWTDDGTPTAKMLTIRDATYAATVGRVDLFVDVIGGPIPYTGNLANHTDTGWVRGLGRVGATTGTGTADYYQSSDNVHPAQAGHDWLGRYIARRYLAALPF